MPQSIENIIGKATVKDPTKRYATVREMEEDIVTALNPDRINEAPLQLGMDEEATKAIPIIREHEQDHTDLDKTVEMPPVKNVAVSQAPVEEKDLQEKTKPAKKQKKKRRGLTIVLVLLFVLIGSVVAAFVLLPNLFRVGEVVIPDVTGMPFEEAELTLVENGLTVEREDVNEDDTVPKDYVIRQNPAPNSTVKENATVRLFVSLGKEEIELDDYVGMPIEEALNMLERLGVEAETTERPTDNQSPGIVLFQDPRAGTSIIVEETTVYLTYSIAEQIRLRDLVNNEEASARSYLNEVGLIPKFETAYSNSVAAGLVIRQNPAPYTMLDKGDEVRLVLSQGPEPQPEPEPDPIRVIQVNQPIGVSDEDREAGNEFRIRIVYRDASTGGQDQVFVEETITETTEYPVELQVSPSQSGSFDVFVNGELIKSSETYRYN